MTASELINSPREEHLQTGADSSAAVRPTTWQIVIWILLLCCVVVQFVVGRDQYQLGATSDDAEYTLLARNLVEKHTYGIDVGGSELWVGFPPGYPLMLGVIVALFPGNLQALRWLSLIATLANLSILFWGWTTLVPRSSYRWGLAVATLYAVAPLTAEHSRVVMSEAVFSTFALVALLLLSLLKRNRGMPWLALLLGADLALATLTRSVGLILVVFIALYVGFRLIRRRHPRSVDAGGVITMEGAEPNWAVVAAWTACGAAVLVGSILVLTPVTTRDLLPEQYRRILAIPCRVVYVPRYCDSVSISPAARESATQPGYPPARRLGNILYEYAYGGIWQHAGSDLRSAVLPLGGGQREQKVSEALRLPELSRYLGYLFTLFMLVGVLRLARQRSMSAFVAFAPFCFVMLFAWEWSQGRILYPILPQLQFILLSAVAAVFAAVNRLVRARGRPAALTVLLCGFVVVMFIGGIAGSIGRGNSRDHVSDLAVRTGWLASASEPGDLISTEAPVVDQLYADRPTIYYPARCDSPEQVLSDLTLRRVAYVLVAAQIRWQEHYVPQYSEQGLCMLNAMEQLSRKGAAELVHSSDEGLVKVFKLG